VWLKQKTWQSRLDFKPKGVGWLDVFGAMPFSQLAGSLFAPNEGVAQSRLEGGS